MMLLSLSEPPSSDLMVVEPYCPVSPSSSSSLSLRNISLPHASGSSRALELELESGSTSPRALLRLADVLVWPFTVVSEARVDRDELVSPALQLTRGVSDHSGR